MSGGEVVALCGSWSLLTGIEDGEEEPTAFASLVPSLLPKAAMAAVNYLYRKRETRARMAREPPEEEPARTPAVGACATWSHAG